MPFSRSQKKVLVALGAKFKEIRMEKGLTLKALAHKIDKEPQSIHRLEVGEVNPSYLYLKEVCVGLGIDITELLADLK